MFTIESTASTPSILIEQESFKMTGICTPENPPAFFEQFKQQFDNLLEATGSIEFTFHLDYFNTGSSKCLLNLFKSMSQKADKGVVKVNWVYEKDDEEMKEAGELYAEIAEMNFEYIETGD